MHVPPLASQLLSSSIHLAGRDGVATAPPPTRAGYTPAAGSARPSAKLLDEHALLHELWQISHFGWIREAVIRRGLTIACGQEVPAAAVAEGLRQLLERGWAEQRDSDVSTREREWRLTDHGRSAR
jgi:hypothetical protein